jgi:glycosyl transferase family 25
MNELNILVNTVLKDIGNITIDMVYMRKCVEQQTYDLGARLGCYLCMIMTEDILLCNAEFLYYYSICLAGLGRFKNALDVLTIVINNCTNYKDILYEVYVLRTKIEKDISTYGDIKTKDTKLPAQVDEVVKYEVENKKVTESPRVEEAVIESPCSAPCAEVEVTTLSGYDHFVNNQDTFIINLDGRKDRWDTITKDVLPVIHHLTPRRMAAIDGKMVGASNQQIQRLFNLNEYFWSRGAIGCALSHLQLWVDFVKSEKEYLFILEDDAELLPNFNDRLRETFDRLDEKDHWDIVYLGHPHYNVPENVYNTSMDIRLERWDAVTTRKISMGCCNGYIMRNSAVVKLLESIRADGLTGAIDMTVMNMADTLELYYIFPHILKMEVHRNDVNKRVDSDIQYDGTTVNIPFMDKSELELNAVFENVTRDGVHLKGVYYIQHNKLPYENGLVYYVTMKGKDNIITPEQKIDKQLQDYIIYLNWDVADDTTKEYMYKMSKKYVVLLYSQRQRYSRYEVKLSGGDFRRPFDVEKDRLKKSGTNVYNIDTKLLLSIPSTFDTNGLLTEYLPPPPYTKFKQSYM